MSNLTFTNVSKVGLSENFYQHVCAPPPSYEQVLARSQMLITRFS